MTVARVRWMVIVGVVGALSRLASAEEFLVDVRVGSGRPLNVKYKRDLAVKAVYLDDRLVGIGNSRIAVDLAPGKTAILSIRSRFGYRFNFTLKNKAGTLELASRKAVTTHCHPIGADAVLRRSASWTVMDIDLQSIGKWMCNSFPATGVPDGRAKVRFLTVPVGATLQLERVGGTDYVSGTTDLSLSIPYQSKSRLSVVFSRDGFVNCTVDVRFEKIDGTLWMIGPGAARQRVPRSTATSLAPKVQCNLRPAP